LKDFRFDLASLRDLQDGKGKCLLPAEGILTSPDELNRFLYELWRDTTLDKGQALALIENLSRELAFTQGPPGTGKTFLGVALVRAIFASQMAVAADHPKPILAVCMTNHALDSFLGDLRKDGINRIARLGGASRESWTKGLQLSELSRKMATDQSERNILKTRLIAVEGGFLPYATWICLMS
jgi:hypothetical protein